MDYLGKHEPVTHVLGEEAAGLVGVELSIGENPEYYEKNPGNGLGCHEMRSIALDIALLC